MVQITNVQIQDPNPYHPNNSNVIFFWTQSCLSCNQRRTGLCWSYTPIVYDTYQSQLFLDHLITDMTRPT